LVFTLSICNLPNFYRLTRRVPRLQLLRLRLQFPCVAYYPRLMSEQIVRLLWLLFTITRYLFSSDMLLILKPTEAHDRADKFFLFCSLE
ncbi:hypothetical protein FBUS_09670, partial [Fasciolopsis buskii]